MGGALGQVGMVAMGLVGLVSVLRARQARRRAAPDADTGPDSRLAARIEMERRMASYLAAREDTRR